MAGVGDYMEIAIKLAEIGRGQTHPNPMVGAVIVKGRRIVGEGWHAKAGEPHAEIHALKQAGKDARGATLYVTLEPCCHHGSTGPCTEAIVKAGIKKVVVGIVDQNPLVRGKGIKALKKAGLSVSVENSQTIAKQNEIFFKFIKSKRPFVLLKIASSLNGKITSPVGSRSRLTDTHALREVHKLRNEYQAVLVGIGTALIDDPLLNCRLEGNVKQPIRIVVDSRGRLPLDSRLVRTADADKVILATTERVSKGRRREFAKTGIELIYCSATEEGQVNIDDLFKRLGERAITSVLVEGGAALNEELLSKDLVDKMVVFIAPVILGEDNSLPMVAGGQEMNRSWKLTDCRIVGRDAMLELYPAEQEN